MKEAAIFLLGVCLIAWASYRVLTPSPKLIVSLPVSSQDYVLTEVIESVYGKDDTPRITRIYTQKLAEGFKVELTAKNRYFRSQRDYSGILTQLDGSWIFFNPENIAERIINKQLVPQVEDFVAKALVLDRADTLTEFMDEQKRIWVLKP